MLLQTFNGGKATRLAPQLLQQNQGVEFENIDNASGILSPVKAASPTAIAVKEYFKYYVAGDEWLSSTVMTDYLEFQKVMYLTDRTTRPQKYSDGLYHNLGITRPSIKPAVTLQKAAEILEDVKVLNDTTVGDLPTSALNYLLFNIKDSVKTTALEITVSESSSAVTRAVVDTRPKAGLGKLKPAVTTTQASTNRAVVFSELQGKFGDSVELYRRYNGEWRLVDTFATITDTLIDSTYDISGNSLLDEATISSFFGTYQYVYTYYNSADGTESAPSPLSTEVEASSGEIVLTSLINSTDPQVTNKRLYRVGGDITQFTLVVELDNVVTSYVDKLQDSELDGRLLESDNYYEAPNGLKFLSESYAMLFGAIGPNLRFTPIGKPNAWPPEYQIEFDADITGIGPVANGLLVMTEDRTFIVTGTGPLSLAQQPLRGDQGCIAFESIQQVTEGTLIWASKDGLCTSSGNNVQNLTKAALGDITLTPISSAVLNEQYYCQNSDGRTLVWDYRFNQIPKDLVLSVSTLGVAKGELYGYKEGFLQQLYASTEPLTFKYLSPRFIEGSYVIEKTYKKFYIRHDGDIIIKIIIDGTIVASKDLKGTRSSEIQIPQDKQRGFSIQFEISGTGTVHEVEYEVGKNRRG